LQCNQENQNCIITNEYSVNGETSFKLFCEGGITETNKTMIVKLKIYSPTAKTDIWLYDMEGSAEVGHNDVRVSPSNQIQEISLTYTGTLSTVTHYVVRVNLLNDDTYYLLII